MTEYVYFIFAAFKPINFSNIQNEIFDLNGDNYKIWKEMILLQLGCMDIDYAIRKDEPLIQFKLFFLFMCAYFCFENNKTTLRGSRISIGFIHLVVMIEKTECIVIHGK